TIAVPSKCSKALTTTTTTAVPPPPPQAVGGGGAGGVGGKPMIQPKVLASVAPPPPLVSNHRGGWMTAQQQQAATAVALNNNNKAALPMGFPSSSSSLLQFSQPRNNNNNNGNTANNSGANYTQHQHQATKKQRSNNGGAIVPPSGGGMTTTIQVNKSHLPQAQQQPQPPCHEGQEICVKCQFPGADVRIRCNGGGGGCAFHARCVDLLSVCGDVSNNNSAAAGPNNPTSSNKRGNINNKNQEEEEEKCIQRCPHCYRPASGMEILPLSFIEMDRVQQNARTAFMNGCAGLGLASSSSSAPTSSMGGMMNVNNKRPNDTNNNNMMLLSMGYPTHIPSHSGAQPPRRSVQCYDPSQPRTGRWSDEEILFRDTLISHFLSGNLPLSNGLKLNDFLPVMLKSKQSRLAKKMKHAKLSTKYFYPKMCCVSTVQCAQELSRMERDFVASIPDPVERSEVAFHMSAQWREHFAQRCHSLRIAFDGHKWLGSVEDMERRLAFEKERHRLVKRRFMMGKAMEKDGKSLEQGVFVNGDNNGREEFELVVEKSVSNSGGRRNSFSGDLDGCGAGGISSGVGGKDKEGSVNVWSSNEPNFKHAAPFLAGIASYIERNGVPFEHVDVWVPSFVEGASTQAAADNASSSSSSIAAPSPPNGNFRLCFGGSVTMGVQIVNSNGGGDETSTSSSSSNTATNTTSSSNNNKPMKRLSLTPDEKSNFGLFGDYSEKFSFNSGCGLPGRIYKSGIPAWEQFVSEAHPGLFERRGGAVQFGVKTALGMPIDSPNVGRVVLVLYSKYDRPKDERLVWRMMTDLKLLNPCPRWKLVVEVDSPCAVGGEGGKSSSSSLQAPPPAATAAAAGDFGVWSNPAKGYTRSDSASSAASGAPSSHNSVGGGGAITNTKDKLIQDLILLLGESIPSNLNSPLGQQLQHIMPLRLILLRGNKRSPEEEALIDTVLVLYESYTHAGRSRSDIAVMVARDFQFHLGHQQGLALRYGYPTQQPNHPQQQQQQQRPHQGSSPSMYGAAAQPPVPPPMPPMGNTPLMGPVHGYNSNVQHHARTTSMGSYKSPILMGSNPIVYYAAQHQQQHQHHHPRSQSMSILPRQTSPVASPRSTVSR
ncbi:hypothetical protein ACHAXR_006183, partial [Thalassiosira sp. AJA248-18]